jgi:Spy/CpxP family protein refolding chaperone
MNAESNAPRPEASPENPRKAMSRSRRWTLAGLAAVTVAAIGTAGAAGWHARAHAHGGHFMGGGWHGDMDPETVGRKIDAMAGWVLADVDATPEQRARVAAAFKSAAADLLALRERHRQARAESVRLLAAPEIDRARLETLRIDQMQLGETVSRRMLQAVIDAAEVLDPAQRAELARRWEERMRHRH